MGDRSTVTVLDLKSRVTDEAKLLAALSQDKKATYCAFTPYSAWLLDSLNIPYQTLSSFISKQDFHLEGQNNVKRVERFIEEVSDGDTASYGGLFYFFKIFLDYATQEDLKLKFLKNKKVRLYTDLSLKPETDLLGHILNQQSLYQQCLAKQQEHSIVYLDRHRSSSGGIRPLAIKWLKKLGARRVKQFLKNLRSDSNQSSVVTAYRYDWACYREEVSKKFKTLSSLDVVEGVSARNPHVSTDVEMARFDRAFSKLTETFSTELNARVDQVLRREFTSYVKIRAQLKLGLAKFVETQKIKIALSTSCFGYDEFLVNFFLKSLGVPTVFHQHGAYFGDPNYLKYSEVLPASLNLAYGTADQKFFASSQVLSRCEVVGSARLEAMKPEASRQRKNHFVYVLDVYRGNSQYVSGPTEVPLLDSIEVFRRHQRVIDLFAQYPEKQLTLKLHPAQGSVSLYAPLEEYIAKIKASNVQVLQLQTTPDQFLSEYEYLILDYSCTTLFEGMAKGLTKIICFLGPPYMLPASAENLIREHFAAALNDDELIAILKDTLENGRFKEVTKEGAAKLDELYGRKPDSAKLVRRLLQEYL